MILLAILFAPLFLFGEVSAHGRLVEPPARNCMWRYGFPNPVNYDDNQNWCGGAAVMLIQNGGKCGVCGDDWAKPQPRAHEAGGEYGNGIIVRRYAPSQTLDIEIDLTANHMGTFQFKLCSVEDSHQEITQECLDKNVLEVIDSSGQTSDKYIITTDEKSKVFYLKLKLPPFFTCSQCVLQWTYVAANTWGPCKNGTEAVGCGPQETFINCADVAIIPNSGGFGPHAPHPKVPPQNVVYSMDLTKNALVPVVVSYQRCVGKGSYSTVPAMDDWCKENCLKYPPNCPEDKCHCISNCDAVGSFKEMSGSGAYCMDKCLANPPTNCTAERCECN